MFINRNPQHRICYVVDCMKSIYHIYIYNSIQFYQYTNYVTVQHSFSKIIIIFLEIRLYIKFKKNILACESKTN